MTQEQRDMFIGGFDSYVKVSYITILFFSIESAFRAFYASTFSKEVPINIYKVFKDLLGEFDLERYKDLLKLFRLTRNSLHNSGVHTSENDEVSWRDKTYHCFLLH